MHRRDGRRVPHESRGAPARLARAAARRGFALVAALGAVAVLGALGAGLLFVVQQEQRVARQLLAAERALAAAELAMARAPSLWDGAPAASIAEGVTARARVALPRGDAGEMRLTRLGPRTALAEGVGESGAPPGRARRAVSLLLDVAVAADSSAVLTPVTPRAWVRTF